MCKSYVRAVKGIQVKGKVYSERPEHKIKAASLEAKNKKEKRKLECSQGSEVLTGMMGVV